jgi:type I restriction enzyme, S subunit
VRILRNLPDDFSEYALSAGDIVIAMDRPVISTGLKVARVSEVGDGCLLVERVARYSPSRFRDNDFIWNLINSQLFIDHAVTQATGSDLPHISANDILRRPCHCQGWQNKEKLFALSKLHLRGSTASRQGQPARKLTDHLDQAILSKAFRGELVPQDAADEPASVLLNRIRAERTIGH